MFHFTPLLGAQSDSPASQSLLELDNGIKILIDVGWDSTFDVKMLAELERHTPTIDLILLTHPTLEHMGAYAHACKHIPSFNAIPVYSTFPVSNLGRLLLQDIYLSSPKACTRLQDSAPTSVLLYPPSPSSINWPADYSRLPGDLPEGALKLPPTSAEIDSYCGKIVTLKYSQPTPLHSAVARVAGKLGSVTITAYSAGHSLGGTIWKIQQAQESIVYAVDWNLSRENCLRGAAFLGGEGGRVQEALLKPTALVCSSKNATTTNIAGGRKKRDEVLLETIRKTAVEKGGTVLIPTDSVGRVLELAYLLEHAWRKDPKFSGKGTQGKGIGLYLAGRKVRRLGQVIGSMLEWMDEAVVREFESIAEKSSQGNANRSNRRGGNKDGDQKDGQSETTGNKAGPFDFLYLNLIATPGQLSKVLNSNDGRGKVVIASDSSLEWGLSRDALLTLANDDKNVVVLTERTEGRPGLAGRLWQGWKEAVIKHEEDSATAGQFASIDTTHEIETSTKTRLEGEALLSYQRHLAARQALTSQHQSLLSSSGLSSGMDADQDDEDASSSSEDDSDSERQGKALTTATSKKLSQATVLMGGVVPAGVTEKVDIGVNVLLRGEGVYDYDVRGAKGRNRMFPFQVRRKRIDEYGEVVRPDDYMRAEERQDEDLDIEEEESAEAKKEETRVMGKKRKWEDDRKAKTGASGRKGGAAAETGTSKKRRQQRKPKGKKSPSDDDYDPERSASEEGEISDSGDDEGEGEDDEEALAAPSELHTTWETMRIHISATFIDFSGLHDQKSLRMLLPLIDPKKLILIGGKREETKYLAEFYREKAALSSRGASSRTDVFSPQAGIKVNASVDTNAWMVALGNTISRGMKWQNVRGLSVVHVIGRVAPTEPADGEEPGQKKQKLLTSEGESSGTIESKKLVLDTLPPALAAATRSFTQPIHVGDIRLADLRRVMQDEGHTAEFKGEGTLLVDGFVVVRKTGVGSVAVEDGGGGFTVPQAKGRTFVQVRRKVYEGLAVVAGGMKAVGV
ncbi:beta-lactamase-like protein [Sphaerosporella brunnea]|uniref:Cleavage and polyadenylation specificity factor subunit 2 n=1 Tax=Sphaerosporella brunnea TaxID=1250544 RepID=A0A5J5F143_9PEZI|nr:beta-lactamase-like protein [Sphaerosporella brunnea]